jgi:hypothetical protein
VYREVRGQYIQQRWGTKEQLAQIDRVLTPSQKLVQAGWPHGPIGVEIEASGHKVAGPIEQAMDYSRAVWTIIEGFHLCIEWFFVWCWDAGAGNVASLAMQNRIGGVSYSHNAHLVVRTAGGNAITIYDDGTIAARRLLAGRKTGHRNS